MSRIRTIKPDFFRHEKLFDLEVESGLPVRLAYAGLWTIADREGRFKWRPRAIKPDILPYDDIDFSRVLDALATRGFIVHYASNGEEYGAIPSWKAHQVINNRESLSVLPDVSTGEVIAHAWGTRESRVVDLVMHAQGEGKGREGKGREGVSEDSPSVEVAPQHLPSVAHPKTKRHPREAKERDPLRDALAASFRAKVPEYANPPRENANLLRLADAIRRKATASGVGHEVAAQGIVETFWKLHETGKAFYADFTPSKALSILESLWGELAKGAAADDMSWMEVGA